MAIKQKREYIQNRNSSTAFSLRLPPILDPSLHKRKSTTKSTLSFHNENAENEPDFQKKICLSLQLLQNTDCKPKHNTKNIENKLLFLNILGIITNKCKSDDDRGFNQCIAIALMRESGDAHLSRRWCSLPSPVQMVAAMALRNQERERTSKSKSKSSIAQRLDLR